jgi:Na+-driven multidrug efflux pump
VKATLRASLVFMVVAVAVAWGLLAVTQDWLALAFSSQGVAAQLLHLFCTWIAGTMIFAGGLFVANAAFNNLDRPTYATVLNWGRATLGTIPFVHFGARFGPQGVVIGQALGSVIFGLAAVALAFVVTETLHRRASAALPEPIIAVPGGRGTAVNLVLEDHPPAQDG